MPQIFDDLGEVVFEPIEKSEALNWIEGLSHTFSQSSNGASKLYSFEGGARILVLEIRKEPHYFKFNPKGKISFGNPSKKGTF